MQKQLRQLRQFRHDVSISAFIAGLLAVLISYAGPLVIVFQAAKLSGLSTQMTSSWIWAISIGSGLTGLILSWRLKVPVITAWSTPGAALLIGLLPHTPYPQAIGAYLASALVIVIIGFSGAFDRVMERMPKGIAAALLAGILLRFGMEVFSSISINPILVLVMIGAYIAVKRASPRYAIAGVMIVGIVAAMLADKTHISEVTLDLVTPIFVIPEWSWTAVLNMGLPLAIVSLTGQFVPGMAVMRASGYKVRAKEIITTTGIASFLLAPFGSHGVNLAAITAAICTGKEANEDPAKRYVAGIFCGLIYILIGLFGGAIALLFSALPKELIATLAGLALIGAITSGIVGMVADEGHRDASVITFLATASGMHFLGMGSAFWGLGIGCLAYFILHKNWSSSKKSPQEIA
ncbi:benzoate/H(+) symporter BenE family transporter [Polynucleobacter sp. JS-Safj-400b-B2]|uniref:benzoate/H(+) symporter BenE family transporter n=1 Tax=Polynucleobacter sp. JS-Safj-400b-B2 TaxID=2576921 RepID=UPI001C0E77BA|nr:benzoate/H(+) symporter BenE family transporter [Polynucleobacter sp. JS-Safj-400b-B2]MBU3624755.1 benzoate/H(+) symporter BenE family transporter [Polynucleobacter sp. JS-Safj-400b-B2]